MLVPLEEMLLRDNMDGTISVFFRRQFRRKVWHHHIITLEINYGARPGYWFQAIASPPAIVTIVTTVTITIH